MGSDWPYPNNRRVWRVARNLVLLQPMLHPGQTRSGLVVPNKYDKPAVHFRVIGIGPGAIVKQGKKKRFIKPEVMPGDVVLSKHWTEGHGEVLPQPVHVDREDGKGLVFVDSRYIIAKIEFPTSDPVSQF